MAKATRAAQKPSSLQEAWAWLRSHPMIGPLAAECHLGPPDDSGAMVSSSGWARIDERGRLRTRRGSAQFGSREEWSWALGCLLLEAALLEWREGLSLTQGEKIALRCEARRLARLAKAGTPPDGHAFDLSGMPSRPYRELGAWIDAGNLPAGSRAIPPSLAGEGRDELIVSGEKAGMWNQRRDLSRALADGISAAAESAIDRAGGRQSGSETLASQARRWIMDHYPLLGASACLFSLVEDADVCDREGISVAAVAPGSLEIFLHPRARLSLEECKFVLAHEILHAALDHLGRRRGRDPLLWNYACDFAVNGWLEEMRLGTPPGLGLLRDPCFDGKSAEDIYDALAAEGRRSKKLLCLSGASGMGDMIERSGAVGAREAALRRALLSGMETHRSLGRGSLPGGLEEEIRAIAAPPAPWDVRLAEWMVARFSPEERSRTYGRLSRRQSACPDIPLPGRERREADRKARALGAIVDTSASMDRHLLGKALGALASTCESLDVDFVRLVWCDAGAADMGWKDPADLWGKIRAKGRGGTALQEGIDLLARAADQGDFPKGAPVLILTDGWCEETLDSRGFDTAAMIPPGAPKPQGVREWFRLE